MDRQEKRATAATVDYANGRMTTTETWFIISLKIRLKDKTDNSISFIT